MYNTLLRSILFNRAVTQEVAALLESVDVQLPKKESLHAYIVANHIIPCSFYSQWPWYFQTLHELSYHLLKVNEHQ